MQPNVIGGSGDDWPTLQYRCKDTKYFVINKLLSDCFYEC